MTCRARLELPSLGIVTLMALNCVRAAQRAPCLLVTCLSQQCTVCLLTLPCLAAVCSSLGTIFSSPSTTTSPSVPSMPSTQRAVVFWLRMCEIARWEGCARSARRDTAGAAARAAAAPCARSALAARARAQRFGTGRCACLPATRNDTAAAIVASM